MENLNFLFELNELAKKDALLQTKGKHFTGIVGPRGVGKTILLKQLALSE